MNEFIDWIASVMTKSVTIASVGATGQPEAPDASTGRAGGKESIVVDYASEFDQSRHAVSIEQSREHSSGCDRREE